jgi:hypothetical protein
MDEAMCLLNPARRAPLSVWGPALNRLISGGEQQGASKRKDSPYTIKWLPHVFPLEVGTMHHVMHPPILFF